MCVFNPDKSRAVAASAGIAIPIIWVYFRLKNKKHKKLLTYLSS